MPLKSTFEFSLNNLKEKWLILQNIPKVFAYNLNVTEKKYLPGKFAFYAELNPERTQLRRIPQVISSLKPEFDSNKFNFKKINALELIMTVPFEGIEVSMIINRSPLTQYHTLIVPDLEGEHAQRLTLVSLRFSVALLRLIEEKSFCIGYNSPGALASVNHLHLHLMYLDNALYIDKARLHLISDNYIYKLHKDMPTEAICFIIHKTDTESAIDTKIQQIYNFITWLCDHKMPHNLFLTKSKNELDELKIFIYAREKFCDIKDLKTYNIAFCEFSGYLPVGDKAQYDNLAEENVIAKISAETGSAYKPIYKYFER